MLTAAEVEQKTFSTALRGYDLDEVDDFLDEVVATIRALNDQLEAAKSGSAPATPPPVPVATERATPGPIDESAVGRALVAAQTAADRLLEEARSEALQIVDGAKDEADTWASERDAKRAEAQNEIAALASRVASVRSELSVLAGEVSGKLDEMDDVIEREGDLGPSLQPVPVAAGAHMRPDGDEGEGQGEPGTEYRPRFDEMQSAEGEHDIEDSSAGSDELDDILNGVATDLQLGSGNGGTSEEEGEEEGEEDGED